MLWLFLKEMIKIMENKIIAMGYYMDGLYDDEDMEIITLLQIYKKYYIMFESKEECTLELVENEKNVNDLKRKWDLSESKILLADFNEKYFYVLYQLMKETQKDVIALSISDLNFSYL